MGVPLSTISQTQLVEILQSGVINVNFWNKHKRLSYLDINCASSYLQDRSLPSHLPWLLHLSWYQHFPCRLYHLPHSFHAFWTSLKSMSECKNLKTKQGRRSCNQPRHTASIGGSYTWHRVRQQRDRESHKIGSKNRGKKGKKKFKENLHFIKST